MNCVIYLYGGWVLTRHGRRRMEHREKYTHRMRPELLWPLYWASDEGRRVFENNEAMMSEVWDAL